MTAELFCFKKNSTGKMLLFKNKGG